MASNDNEPPTGAERKTPQKDSPARTRAQPAKRPPVGPSVGGASAGPRKQPASTQTATATASTSSPAGEAPAAVQDPDPITHAATPESFVDRALAGARRLPRWAWAVVAVLVVVVIALIVVPHGSKDDTSSGSGSDDQFTITYREQLTQNGTQAGCFVLMQGTRAIGLSCLPSK